MADFHSPPPCSPHNFPLDPPPRSSVSVRSPEGPADACIVPGLQAQDLAFGGNSCFCGISDDRLDVGPGIGTMFTGSFADLGRPVAPRFLQQGQQAIRRALGHRLMLEAIVLVTHARRLTEMLESDRWAGFPDLTQRIDRSLTAMSRDAGWIGGTMVIVGGPPDPLIDHLNSSPSAR